MPEPEKKPDETDLHVIRLILADVVWILKEIAPDQHAEVLSMHLKTLCDMIGEDDVNWTSMP